MGTRASLLLVILGVLLWTVPTAAGDRLIASGAYPVGSLSAYGGVVAWGDSDSYFSATGGTVGRLPIDAPGGGALGEIDLGPRPGPGVAAVYLRCKSSGDESGPVGCDIYRYGFTSHHSEPVRRASTRRWEESAPSTWGGRVVFVRGDGMFATNPFARLQKQEILKTDLRGHTVAFWSLRGEIVVKRFDRRGRGRACRIAHGRGGESPAPGDLGLGSPQLDGRYVYWTRMAGGQHSGVSTGTATVSEGRRLLPSRRCRPRGREQRTRVLFRLGPHDTYDLTFSGFAVARGRLYYATTKQRVEPPFPYQSDIWETQPVRFENR